MNKEITIIDLLNKIANGEEVPKKIRIDHWCYTFEWVEHDENYYDRHYEIDLMSCLSMSAEELNYGVQIIEEDNKIKKIKELNNVGNSKDLGEFKDKQQLNNHILKDKINELIDEINALELIDEVNALKEKNEN